MDKATGDEIRCTVMNVWDGLCTQARTRYVEIRELGDGQHHTHIAKAVKETRKRSGDDDGDDDDDGVYADHATKTIIPYAYGRHGDVAAPNQERTNKYGARRGRRK
ncbi:hypothetical protein X777_12632, partial [Ooceraea biroi]